MPRVGISVMISMMRQKMKVKPEKDMMAEGGAHALRLDERG